jgi:hypothetical protein
MTGADSPPCWTTQWLDAIGVRSEHAELLIATEN